MDDTRYAGRIHRGHIEIFLDAETEEFVSDKYEVFARTANELWEAGTIEHMVVGDPCVHKLRVMAKRMEAFYTVFPWYVKRMEDAEYPPGAMF